MTGTSALRGQPLLVLAGLLTAWLALRIAVWQPAFDFPLAAQSLAVEALPLRGAASTAGRRFTFSPDRLPAAFAAGSTPADAARRAPWIAPSPRARSSARGRVPGHARARLDFAHAAIGHSLLLAVGLSQMDLPPVLTSYLQGLAAPGRGVPAAAPPVAALPPPASSAAGSRWSSDAWLMVRDDRTSGVVSGRPSYGRSQAGAVVRFRLAPSSAHAPQAYARASTALSGALEKDLVAGVSARLVPALPVRFAAEARISQTAAGTELRPAVIAVTEFPPVALPRGVRAEAYVQAGYVGGRFATAFVDGQGRVERPIARLGPSRSGAELTAGAGAWGGAQEGAARLDIGPTAAVSFRLGEARGRVAADYRFRVAGDAEPESGPALTLSAGF